MPAGLGIYDGGRSTAAEDAVLATMNVGNSDPDALVRTAARVVNGVSAGRALQSKDIRKPIVSAFPVVAHPGEPARLAFSVIDDSGWTRWTVQISTRSGRTLATLKRRLALTNPQKAQVERWRVPAHVVGGRLRFCVVATDPSGNRSPKSCADITIR